MDNLTTIVSLTTSGVSIAPKGIFWDPSYPNDLVYMEPTPPVIS